MIKPELILGAVAAVLSLGYLVRRPGGASAPAAVPPGEGGAMSQVEYEPLPGLNISQPRGIRNNNPGNIEANAIKWQGATGNDGRFVVFDTPENGIRALARILKTYRDKYGLETVRGIVSRWAPPSENNTGAYIGSVCSRVSVAPDARLAPADYPALVAAIIRHENGVQPYNAALIDAATRAGMA